MTWKPTKLQEILIPIQRTEKVDHLSEYQLLGVRLEGAGPFLRENKYGSEIAATALSRVETGDFIYSRLFAWRGAFGLVSKELNGCYVSSEFPTFNIVQTKVLPQFLLYWFRLPEVLKQVEALCSGSTPLTRNRLKEIYLLGLEIPLPSLDEQKRIVTRIEEVSSTIEKIKDLKGQDKDMDMALAQTIESLVNQESFGKLTLAELLYENSLNGLSQRPSDSPPGTPVLRISAATSRLDAIINEEDFKYLNIPDTEVAKYRLESGDLLACRFNGNLHYVGRFALYTGYSQRKHVYPDKLIRFRVAQSKILSYYACLVLNSNFCRTAIEALCATTAGNIGISAGKLKSIKLPVPTLDTQRAIIDEINDFQTKWYSIKELRVESTKELDSLLPSILDKAFKGEL